MSTDLTTAYATANDYDRSGVRLTPRNVFARLDPRPSTEWLWPWSRPPVLRLA